MNILEGTLPIDELKDHIIVGAPTTTGIVDNKTNKFFIGKASERTKRGKIEFKDDIEKQIYTSLSAKMNHNKEENSSSYTGLFYARSTNGKVKKLKGSNELKREDFIHNTLPTHLCTEVQYGRNIYGTITMTTNKNSKTTEMELKLELNRIIRLVNSDVETEDSRKTPAANPNVEKTLDYTFVAQLSSTSVKKTFWANLNEEQFVQHIKNFNSNHEGYDNEAIVAFKFIPIVGLEQFNNEFHKENVDLVQRYYKDTRDIYTNVIALKNEVTELQKKAIKKAREVKTIDLSEYHIQNKKCSALVFDIQEKTRNFPGLFSDVLPKSETDAEKKLKTLHDNMRDLLTLNEENLNATSYLEKFSEPNIIRRTLKALFHNEL
jgi:hypothetical protein